MNQRFRTALIYTAALPLVGVFAAPAFATVPSCSQFDSDTLSNQTGVFTCVVAPDVVSLDAIVTGAGGAGGGGVRNSFGGAGALVTTTIPVTPGETLTVEVGSGGHEPTSSSLAQGGGGGGWSAVFRGGTALVIAGGGGGGGAADVGTTLPGTVTFQGGDGGEVGGPGVPSMLGSIESADWAASGLGGLATASSNGGQASGQSGTDGTASTGGTGGEPCSTGGSSGGASSVGGSAYGSCYGSSVGTGAGGGAGVFGGGGGGAVFGSLLAGGSGGGGSSAVASGTASYAVATNAGPNHSAGGNGRVQLVANGNSSASTPTPSSTAEPTGSPSSEPTESPSATPTASSAASALEVEPGFGVGDPVPNAPVTLAGTSLQPNSPWTAELHSTPVILASGITDSTGSFNFTALLPADVAPGPHTITLTGTAPDGSQWVRSLYLTVGSNLRVAYVSADSPEGGLALTGVSVAAILVLGLGGTATGLLALRHSRRRRAVSRQ